MLLFFVLDRLLRQILNSQEHNLHFHLHSSHVLSHWKMRLHLGVHIFPLPRKLRESQMGNIEGYISLIIDTNKCDYEQKDN